MERKEIMGVEAEAFKKVGRWLCEKMAKTYPPEKRQEYTDAMNRLIDEIGEE